MKEAWQRRNSCIRTGFDEPSRAFMAVSICSSVTLYPALTNTSFSSCGSRYPLPSSSISLKAFVSSSFLSTKGSLGSSTITGVLGLTTSTSGGKQRMKNSCPFTHVLSWWIHPFGGLSVIGARRGLGTFRGESLGRDLGDGARGGMCVAKATTGGGGRTGATERGESRPGEGRAFSCMR